ncbi:MAG: helicase PcrA, partial [Bacillota bacterium]
VKTVQLFRTCPEVLAFYQDKIRYLHVDEYQDTNYVQYVLLRLLAVKHRNLCVVGDHDQSIYAFRGADVRNITNFEQDFPEYKLIKLEQNYRSTQPILTAANRLIKNNSARHVKKLWTAKKEGAEVEVIEVDDSFSEAAYVADQILRIRERGVSFNQFAVLYRTNAQSRSIEEVFLKADIPYRIYGGVKFYDRKEIKDLLAYLRLLINPQDDISYLRIVNVPRRGIGAVTLAELASYAKQERLSLLEASIRAKEVLRPLVFNALEKLYNLLSTLRANMKDFPVSLLAKEVLQKTGYQDSLVAEKSLEAEARLENLEEFINVARGFEQRSAEKDLLTFLTELALVTELEEEQQEEAVSLMTLHTAKGLEFSYVFILGLEEGFLPHSRTLLKESEIEEERRLAYVGITRAQKELYLLHAKSRYRFGQVESSSPSRFLREMVFIKSTFKHPKQQLTPKVGTNAAATWQQGDKVMHKKWGEGVVVQVLGIDEAQELNVSFAPPIGIKKLLARYAPLSKL